MESMRKLILLFAVSTILAAGCKSGSHLTVTERTTAPLDMIWTVDGKPTKWSKVSLSGNDTILDVNGHVYIFRNRTGWLGRLEYGRANIQIADLRVEADEDSITIIGDDFKINSNHPAVTKRGVLEGKILRTEEKK